MVLRWTRPGIEPEFTLLVVDILSTLPLNGQLSKEPETYPFSNDTHLNTQKKYFHYTIFRPGLEVCGPAAIRHLTIVCFRRVEYHEAIN